MIHQVSTTTRKRKSKSHRTQCSRTPTYRRMRCTESLLRRGGWCSLPSTSCALLSNLRASVRGVLCRTSVVRCRFYIHGVRACFKQRNCHDVLSCCTLSAVVPDLPIASSTSPALSSEMGGLRDPWKHPTGLSNCKHDGGFQSPSTIASSLESVITSSLAPSCRSSINRQTKIAVILTKLPLGPRRIGTKRTGIEVRTAR